MFGKIAKATTLATVIAIGTAGMSTTPAAAGGIGIEFQFGSPGYGPGYGHGPRYGNGPAWGPGWGQGPAWGNRGFCKPRRAVKKARNMGVRKARIVRKNNRKVVVKGWRHGYPAKVVFANRHRCPVIALR